MVYKFASFKFTLIIFYSFDNEPENQCQQTKVSSSEEFSAFSGAFGVAHLVQVLDRIVIKCFSVQMKYKQDFYEIYSHQALV